VDRGVGGEHVVDPLGRHRGPLGLGHDHAQHAQRPDEHGDVDVEHHQRAQAEVAGQHLVAAVGEHGDEPQVGQQLEPGQEHGPGAGGGHRLVVDVPGLGAESPGLDPLGAQALDDPHAGHRLLHHRGQLGRLALDAHDAGEQPAGEPGGQHVEEGQRPQRQQRQHRVDDGEDHRHRQHGHRVGDGQRDHHHEGLDLLEVGVGPAHELAGLRLVVEGEVEALEVGEQPVAQVGLDPAGLTEGEPPAQAGEGGRGDGHAPEDQRPAPQRPGVVGDDALVDGVADQQAGAHLGGRPRQADGDADRDAPAALADELEDQPPAPAAERALGEVVGEITPCVCPALLGGGFLVLVVLPRDLDHRPPRP
jgi:hypothetical protein